MGSFKLNLHQHARDNRRGFLLILGMFLMTGMLTVTVVGLRRSLTDLSASNRYVSSHQALHLAETGVDQALRWLNDPTNASSVTPTNPYTCPGACVPGFAAGTSTTYTITTTGGTQRIITAIGRVTGPRSNVTRRVEVVARVFPSPAIPWAAYGEGQVVLAGESHVDSYDSTVAPYVPGCDPDNPVCGHQTGLIAKIQTNGTSSTAGDEAIRLRQEARLWGDAIVGPGGSAMSSIDVIAGVDPAAIYGTPVPPGAAGATCTVAGRCVANAPITPPTVTLPVGTPTGAPFPTATCAHTAKEYCVGAPCPVGVPMFSYSNLDTDTNCDVTLWGNGDLFLNDLHINGGGGQLILNGDITFTVTGPVQFDQDVLVSVQSGKQVQLYVDGDVTIKGGVLINTLNDKDPKKFLFSIKGYHPVSFVGQDAVMYMRMIAPGSDVWLSGGSHLFGAVVGRTVELRQYTQIHYDFSLQTPQNGKNVQILSWREL